MNQFGMNESLVPRGCDNCSTAAIIQEHFYPFLFLLLLSSTYTCFLDHKFLIFFDTLIVHVLVGNLVLVIS